MGCICMYTPSASGGHALYTWELMTALTLHADAANRFELVTSENLAPEFKEASYPVHTILPPLSHRREFSTNIAWATSRVLHYPVRELTFLRWLKGRPDITGVHFQEYKPWLAGPLFRRLRRDGKKIFYTVHNIRPHEYPPGIPKPLMDHWTHSSWHACDGLFVHTPRLAEELATLLGKGHPPIHVSPHGTWTVHKPVEIPAIEERLKWKRLLFFGTIRRNKGLDVLLDAMELLPGYSLTIAGESHGSDYYRDQIVPQIDRLRAKGIPIELLHHFTPDDQVGPLFARHSAIVLPYTHKFVAQSGVAFLSLAHEMPVIASEVGGLRDLFSEYEIGATFGEVTPTGLAAAVRGFFERKPGHEIVRQMRAARDHYSWSAAAEATIAGYATPREAAAPVGAAR